MGCKNSFSVLALIIPEIWFMIILRNERVAEVDDELVKIKNSKDDSWESKITILVFALFFAQYLQI